MLQQYLPLAVLKLLVHFINSLHYILVATVLTACGIETLAVNIANDPNILEVATVLTACGIETKRNYAKDFISITSLQQYLPLAVLKRETA